MNSDNINALIVGSTVTALAGCLTYVNTRPDPPMNDDEKCRLDCRKAFSHFGSKDQLHDGDKLMKCYELCTKLKRMTRNIEYMDPVPEKCNNNNDMK